MIIQFPKPKKYGVYVNGVCVAILQWKSDAEKMARHMQKTYGYKTEIWEAA